MNDAIEILSSHYVEGPDFDPTKMYNGGSICTHSTDFTNPSHSVGFMIAEIRRNEASTFWFTGTSNPCLSLYKPFFIGGNSLTQTNFKEPGEKFDDSFWWQSEKFQRQVMKNYQDSKPLFNSERLSMQQSFIENEKRLIKEKVSLIELDKFSVISLIKHTQAIEK